MNIIRMCQPHTMEGSGTIFLQIIKNNGMGQSDKNRSARNNFLQTNKIIRMGQPVANRTVRLPGCNKLCDRGSKCSVQINPGVFFPIFRIQHTPVRCWPGLVSALNLAPIKRTPPSASFVGSHFHCEG